MSYNPFSNGQYNTPPPTLTNGQVAPLQLDANGQLKVVSSGSSNPAAGPTGGSAPADADYVGYSAPGTPVFIQASPTASTSAGTCVITPGSNVGAGHTVLVPFWWDRNDTATVPTIADSLGNPWRTLKVFDSGAVTAMVIYASTITNAGAFTITVTTGARGGGLALEYSGLAGTMDQSAQISATTGTTLTTPATGTTTSQPQLLFAFAASVSNGAGAMTAGAGYTIAAQGGITSLIGQLTVETQTVSATGTYTASISGMGSGSFNGLLLITLPTTQVLVGVSATTPLPTTDAADGSTGSATPSKAILVGASDGTNLQPLQVESSSNKNLRVSVFNGANEMPSGDNVARPIITEMTDGTNILGTTAHPVQTADQAEGTVAAGTAAGKSLLTGGVFNTSAPALTNGQQAASQFDASGNLRVNPSGSVGSFATTTVTSPGNGGTVQLIVTVPAATKWQLQTFSLLVQAANASTPRVVSANIADAAGKFPVSIAAGVNAPINANTFYTFGPSLPLSTVITATNASVPCPQVAMGPAFTVNVFIQNTNAGDTLTVTANYISYPN